MTTRPPKEITQLLIDWRNGDKAAVDQLMPLVYDELRRLASNFFRRERVNHTLQPSALVHEAYLHLVGQSEVGWQNRAHFFGAAAQLMRHILIDHARMHNAAKRGGGDIRVSLKEELAATEQSRIVEMRFFGGLSIEETAEVLAISPATVKREWSTAKAWLYHEMKK
jgi:RNA polymerase sigma-70 factor, ECF subfamily